MSAPKSSSTCALTEAALTAAREIKAHVLHCRVILTVNEMKRLGRDIAEPTALADHFTAQLAVPRRISRRPQVAGKQRKQNQVGPSSVHEASVSQGAFAVEAGLTCNCLGR